MTTAESKTCPVCGGLVRLVSKDGRDGYGHRDTSGQFDRDAALRHLRIQSGNTRHVAA